MGFFAIRFYVFAFVVFLSFIAADAQIYRSNSGETYELTQSLGRGSFGEVWAATDSNSRAIGLKFFYRLSEAKGTLHIYRSISDWQDQGYLTGLIRTYAPEQLTSIDGSHSYYAVRVELADGNLESVRKSHFLLSAAVSLDDRLKRILRARKVIKDISHAILELRDRGLNHNDVNPRNILRVGSRYKLGDLDGVRRHGVAPPRDAYELLVAPVKYDDPSFSFDDDNAGDTFQLASTVYYLLFGAYPLVDLGEAIAPGKNIFFIRSVLQHVSIEDVNCIFSETLGLLQNEYFSFEGQLSPDHRQAVAEVFEFLKTSLQTDQKKSQKRSWVSSRPAGPHETKKVIRRPIFKEVLRPASVGCLVVLATMLLSNVKR